MLISLFSQFAFVVNAFGKIFICLSLYELCLHLKRKKIVYLIIVCVCGHAFEISIVVDVWHVRTFTSNVEWKIENFVEKWQQQQQLQRKSFILNGANCIQYNENDKCILYFVSRMDHFHIKIKENKSPHDIKQYRVTKGYTFKEQIST